VQPQPSQAKKAENTSAKQNKLSAKGKGVATKKAGKKK
jgi:hypothetical protein